MIQYTVMNRLKYFIFMGAFLSTVVFGNGAVFGGDLGGGDITYSSNSDDDVGYYNAGNITVVSGGSLKIYAVNGGYISVNNMFSVQGDFFHNRDNSLITSDPTFLGSGSFAFTGDNAIVSAKRLNIGGDLLNGDGTSGWDLTLNVNTVDIGGSLVVMDNSKLVINFDFTTNPSLVADIVDIDGGLYMGDSLASGDIVHINSNDNNNVYKISVLDTLDVNGDVYAENGILDISAKSIRIGGDLAGNVNIDTKDLHVENDVLGGIRFRPNLPSSVTQHDDLGAFHVNPDTGVAKDFRQTNITIDGTYYFDDNSYLQLVLNSGNIGGLQYDPDTDNALMTVGNFDASGMTQLPNFNNIDSTPNIEILVDNIDKMIQKIRLIEVDSAGSIDMGMLNFAGVWFYEDKVGGDGINDYRLFQEARLIEENNNIYAVLAMMQSIEGLTVLSPLAGGNDIQVAKAVDDLILLRLLQHPDHKSDKFDDHYTSVMRKLFAADDVYYDLMLNGGVNYDATDVMVSESPDRALGFVRGLGLGDMAGIGHKLALSGRLSRNAITDQLHEDFVWKRYYDKNVGWLRMNFADDINSFNVGFDTKINNYIVGATLGYNTLNFGGLDGSMFNFGLYGTYDLNNIVRLYANANLALHMVDLKTDMSIIGQTTSDISTVDTTLDIGILHKIAGTYMTGRGYLMFGMLGGYDFTQQYKNQDFMDIRTDNNLVFAPGYELLIGKDIWFSVNSFIRPALRIGVEYDVLGNMGTHHLDFKFSDVNIWRKWEFDESNPLWLRMGGQIDFSFIVGTNISVGYEVLKNGDFKTNVFRLNGVYRF